MKKVIALDKKTVLVVDDDPDMLSLVEMVLDEENYRVVTAENGVEGLSRARDERPDLILLDMKMPVMDGWEFSRRYHEDFGHGVPIIVFTAAQDARRRAEEIGAQGYLGKPFELEQLLSCVRRYIDDSQNHVA